MNEIQPARTILEQADTMVRTDDLVEGIAGVVMEMEHIPGQVEGTLIYFPGVTAGTLIKEGV